MKKENLMKNIFVSVAIFGITVCVALLFPQMRQLIIGIGEKIIGRSLNADRWDHLLLVTALVYFCIITAFLIIFFTKFEIPQISFPKNFEIILICVYSLMLIFLSLVNNAIWVDEAYSLSFIQHSWNDLIQLLIMDVHPPFYYIILKAVSLIFGSSIFVMKMVSVFPIVLMVIFVTLFLKKEFSRKAALVFLLSCIVSQSITYYAIEIRMYSWALFFITSMAISAWYFFKSGEKRWWITMLLCALGAAYTQYWAAVGAAIGYILLFFYAFRYRKDKIISMLLLAVFGIVLYLPWLPVFIAQFTQVSSNYWIKPLSIQNVFDFIMILFSTGNLFVNLFLFLMFSFIFISFFIRKNKTEEDFFFFGGFCCAFFLILTGIIISIAIRPLFISRYSIPMCGLVFMFFAIECSLINKKRIITFLYIVLVSMGIMSFSLSAHKEIKENRDFNAFHKYFTEQMQQDDAFIFIHPDVTGSLHIVGITKHLFPNNIYTHTGTNFGELFNKLWGAAYKSYEENLFHDRTTWIFVIEDVNANTQNSNNIPHDIKGDLIGSFGWDFYRFKLYRRLPNTIFPDNTHQQ